MKQKGSIYKKLHKWPGLIIAFILLYFGITGIVMNHRQFFSPIDISRTALPSQYHYSNWNLAALKGNVNLSPNSILVYGNVGIWLTDSTFTHYTPLNNGFPKGSDNRKIFDVGLSPNGHLYAATLYGLYAFNPSAKRWVKFDIDTDTERFVGIDFIGDTLIAINRSHAYYGKSEGANTQFTRIEIKQPEGYTQEVGLFETMWQIHSGEIFGLPGKLFVDLLGIITIALSVTGILYFFFPGIIRRRKQKQKPVTGLVKTNRWSLKWHNKIGAWLFALLLVVYLTGIFLRPPFLITIANARVKPLRFTHLHQANPWYDRLRDILVDSDRGSILLATSEGIFELQNLHSVPKPFAIQPPVSVMGITVFEKFGGGAYIVGSFSGIFLWHPSHPEIVNYATGTTYQPISGGRPVGDQTVTGLIKAPNGKHFMVDYAVGTKPLWHNQPFPSMPQNVITDAKMSLWNLSLEIHTGRIFQGIMGLFYILIVPLSGLIAAMVVISGYLLWWKRFRKKGRVATSPSEQN